MKNILRVFFILTMCFLFLFCGMTNHKIVKKTPVVVVPEAPKDILTEILSKKDNKDELRNLLGALLRNGQILERDLDSRRFADGSVLTKEKWLLKDEGSNLHAVFIEQHILIGIKRVKNKDEWLKIKPYGGWAK